MPGFTVEPCGMNKQNVETKVQNGRNEFNLLEAWDVLTFYVCSSPNAVLNKEAANDMKKSGTFIINLILYRKSFFSCPNSN